MDKSLRLLAAEMITFSKLSKPAKLQMLEFIRHEATDAQLKALLLDGKIVRLDEQAEEIVNDRFIVSEVGGRVAKLRKSYMSQYGSGGGLNIFWLLYRKIRSAFDECTKQCGKYELNTSRRQHCMLKCRVGMLKSKLAAAKKAGKEGVAKDTEKSLKKAQQALEKSRQSFAKRGASE